MRLSSGLITAIGNAYAGGAYLPAPVCRTPMH